MVPSCKSTNEYYQKNIYKSGHKMDLYPAMDPHSLFTFPKFTSQI